MRLPSIFFAVALVIAGCSGGTTPASPEPPSTGGVASSPSGAQATVVVELRFDVTVESDDLKLRWLDLEDSRCPIGVTCVWAGETVVTVEVVRGEREPIRVKLLRRAGREPETSSVYDYELKLLQVDPHPKEGQTPARGDYVARLEIGGL